MVKVGIVGSGFGLYGLLPAFNSTPGCKVTSICGKKTERFLNYCQSIGLERIYTAWQEMLNQEKLDVLAIAVSPIIQYQIAKIAVKKKLHIFAEKPLAANLKQAKELSALAKKNKIITAIDFLFPEIEEWKEVKKIIDQQKYGNLKKINLKWDFLSYDIKNKIASWKTDTSLGGGALSFYFSHSLYYLEYFAGKILNFKSTLSYSRKSINGGEVGVDLILRFENSVNGHAHLSCNSRDLNKHQLIFICDNGTIVLENENSITSNFTIEIHTKVGIKQLLIPKDKGIENEDERVRIVRKLTTRFIDSIIYKKEFIPSFNEGVRVQELIKAIRGKSNV